MFSAEGHYIQIVSRRGAEWSCVLIAISHLFYLASFVSYVRKIWYQICVPIIICYFSLIYHCFGDIYWSFPMLTVLNALQIAIICGSLIAAASLWRWNSATGASQVIFLVLLDKIWNYPLEVPNINSKEQDRKSFKTLLESNVTG